jgi:hypothetical protein
MAKKWIKEAVKHLGALRKTAGVKKGETIPVDELEELADKPGKTGKRARLAITLRKMRKGKK